MQEVEHYLSSEGRILSTVLGWTRSIPKLDTSIFFLPEHCSKVGECGLPNEDTSDQPLSMKIQAASPLDSQNKNETKKIPLKTLCSTQTGLYFLTFYLKYTSEKV